MSKQATNGFTLVELPVVITMTAMLGAMPLPALARAKQQANQSSRLNKLKQFSRGQLTPAAYNR